MAARTQKLTRSPSFSLGWIAVSVPVTIALVNWWQWFLQHGHQLLWWTLWVGLQAAQFVFLIVPIRDLTCIRRLTRAGVLWTAASEVLVLGFVFIVGVGHNQHFERTHPRLQAGIGLAVFFLLLLSVWKVSRNWVAERLRSIVAAPGGGFLLRHDGNPEVAAEVSSLPGAQPIEGSQEWRIPADPEAAAALLRFAKKHGFDFVPARPSRTPRTAS